MICGKLNDNKREEFATRVYIPPRHLKCHVSFRVYDHQDTPYNLFLRCPEGINLLLVLDTNSKYTVVIGKKNSWTGIPGLVRGPIIHVSEF